MWLNYHHLYYFHAIAREGSIARAARKLRLGQPTLSAQLKLLEESLGHRLFDRKHRALKLTDTGKLTLDYANEIFRIGSEMVEAVNDRLPMARTHLQIGVLDSVPKQLIHSLMTEAYRAGDCYITVVQAGQEVLLRELKNHRVDLVLSSSQAPIAPRSHFYSRRIAEMPVVVAGAPKYASLRRGFPRSLAGQKFIAFTEHSRLRSEVMHYFDSREIKIDLIGESQDTVVQKLMAFSGQALIALPLPALRKHFAEKSLVKLGELDGVSEQLWLTSVTRKVENKIAAHLMEHFAVLPAKYS